MDGWADRWLDGWVDEYLDRWMDGRIASNPLEIRIKPLLNTAMPVTTEVHFMAYALFNMPYTQLASL
jgi:hypothetical protein